MFRRTERRLFDDTASMPIKMLAVTFILLLALSGCASVTPDSPTPSGSPAETTTAAPASPSSTSTTTAQASTASCDTALTDSGYAKLAADGLTLRPDRKPTDGEFGAIASAPTGIVCNWTKPSSDISLLYGQAQLNSAAWDAKRGELLSQGWTESNAPVDGVLTGLGTADGPGPFMIWRDGTQHIVSSATYLTLIEGVSE